MMVSDAIYEQAIAERDAALARADQAEARAAAVEATLKAEADELREAINALVSAESRSAR